MNVTVSLEHRFYEFEGKLYTKLAFSYRYWLDYLIFFDSVTIFARVKEVNEWDPKFVRVDGKNVTYVKVPYYRGLKGFLRKAPEIFSVAMNCSRENNNFILRSGNVTNVLWLAITIRNKKYLREFPGNVEEGILGFAGDSLLNRVIAKFSMSLAKYQAKKSIANSFVSIECKNLYKSNKPSYVFSSFDVDEVVYEPKDYSNLGQLKISVLGRLEGEKGHKDLLKALTRLDKVSVDIIGDGTLRKDLEHFVSINHLNVSFHGAITDRKRIFSILRRSDLFVLPSHTEGMPRALLEAMACGLPCVASDVGGIPEIIENEYLFKPKNIDEIVRKISYFHDACLREKVGKRNNETVRKLYSRKKMDDLKMKFWSHLK